jgi:hypothetical protein
MTQTTSMKSQSASRNYEIREISNVVTGEPIWYVAFGGVRLTLNAMDRRAAEQWLEKRGHSVE